MSAINLGQKAETPLLKRVEDFLQRMAIGDDPDERVRRPDAMVHEASHPSAVVDHVLSIVPVKGPFSDLAAYGFPGWEGSNVTADGDGARGFLFRRISRNEMVIHDDEWEFDHVNYGPEGSHWVRAATHMRRVDAAILRARDEDHLDQTVVDESASR